MRHCVARPCITHWLNTHSETPTSYMHTLHTHTTPYTHAHTHKHAPMHTHAHRYTRAHKQTHTHPHTCTHAHIPTHAHIHICIHAHTCTHAHTHTHKNTHRLIRTHRHTHMYTHAHTYMGVSHEICKSTFRLSHCPNFSLRNDRHGVGAAVPRQRVSVRECENAQSVVFASAFSSIIMPIK